MPWPELPASLDMLSNAWDNAIPYLGDSIVAIDEAEDAWNVGDDHLAISYLIVGAKASNLCLDSMLCYIWMFVPKTCLCKVLYQMYDIITGDGEEFSMDVLLNTMLQADPSQVTYFVGLVDAYRQSIWNKPFNKEYYAALARGFQEWP